MTDCSSIQCLNNNVIKFEHYAKIRSCIRFERLEYRIGKSTIKESEELDSFAASCKEGINKAEFR